MEYQGVVKGFESPQRGAERYFLGEISLPKIALPYATDEAMDYLDSEEDDEPGENADDFHTFFRNSLLKRISTNKSYHEIGSEEDENETVKEEPKAGSLNLEYIPALRLLRETTEQKPEIPELKLNYPPREPNPEEFVFRKAA